MFAGREVSRTGQRYAGKTVGEEPTGSRAMRQECSDEEGGREKVKDKRAKRKKGKKREKEKKRRLEREVVKPEWRRGEREKRWKNVRG